LTPSTDPPYRERWARLRFAVIGTLLASPPEPGTLRETLAQLSARVWRHPISGLDVRFGLSTIERWYYAARHEADPVAKLSNRPRPHGRFDCLTASAIELIVLQYREHPGWTLQLHHDNLKVLLSGAEPPLPSYATLRRFFKARGMTRQSTPKRNSAGAVRARDCFEQREVRSYEADYVGALWHLDFHHGSRKVLTATGSWEKPYLMCVIDDRSRLVCHLQWYLDESAQSLIHALSQAFMKRGLPRALMTDNGAAMTAEETTAGLARLGVLHQTTLPYSPYQNAKQESFWGNIEGRLMPMLEGETAPTLDLLNLVTQAWVEQEYHRSEHSEIGATPLARFLAGPDVRRDSPDSAALRDAFRIEVKRRLRRSDGTVALDGRRLEIPSRYCHLDVIHLRYARWDLSRVDMVDPHSGALLCPVSPVDKSANANGARRLRAPAQVDLSPLPPSGMAPLLNKLLAEYAATGLPPAYLPSQSTDQE